MDWKFPGKWLYKHFKININASPFPEIDNQTWNSIPEDIRRKLSEKARESDITWFNITFWFLVIAGIIIIAVKSLL